jgi:hypothetical protein
MPQSNKIGLNMILSFGRSVGHPLEILAIMNSGNPVR